MSETPSLVAISRAAQNAIPGTYIVTLKPHCDLKSHIDSMQVQAHQHATPFQFEVLHQYQSKYLSPDRKVLAWLTSDELTCSHKRIPGETQRVYSQPSH
ncbi:hypothetical protein ACGC1H_001148 [Rhizoctonia solani]